MRYDEQHDCYVGQMLRVPAAVFERAYAARVAAGQDQVRALEDLLDELSWSLWLPGVVPLATVEVPAGSSAVPWQYRPVVAVVHPDETVADDLQYRLEQAGYRAPTFVPTASHGLVDLQAFLTPPPVVCLLHCTTPRRWVEWRVLQAQLPSCRFLSMAVEPACLSAAVPTWPPMRWNEPDWQSDGGATAMDPDRVRSRMQQQFADWTRGTAGG